MKLLSKITHFARQAPVKTYQFLKETFIVIKNHTVSFIKGCYEHAESIALLTLSSIGLTYLIGELPFLWSLPMWLEAPMIAPVIAVLIVMALTKLAEYRTKRRNSVVIVDNSSNLVSLQ